MTREQAREQAIKRAKELYPDPDRYGQFAAKIIEAKQRKAYLKGWKESQKWTKVEDGLPEIPKGLDWVTVWGYNPFWGSCWVTMKRIGDTNFHVWETTEKGDSIIPPTHWQPLPEPPK